MKRNNQTRRNSGFTLIELLVCMAIASVLLGLGVPAMNKMSDSLRLSNSANRLLGHLHLARSEAIKRKARVVLCKSSDGNYCAASGDWDQGWIVFNDANNDGQRAWNEDIIASEGASSGRMHISANQGVDHYVSYAAGGEARLTSGAFQAGTFTLCADSTGRTEARHVVVNAVGRARVDKGLLASCQ